MDRYTYDPAQKFGRSVFQIYDRKIGHKTIMAVCLTEDDASKICAALNRNSLDSLFIFGDTDADNE